MASTAKGKGSVKTKVLAKHIRPHGKRQAAKDVRKDGKKQIKAAKADEDEEMTKKGKHAKKPSGKAKPDYIDIDKDGDKKKAVNDKKVVKEENQLISNFINCILERKYKASHKYLEQIVHHKVVNKMRDQQSDTLF